MKRIYAFVIIGLGIICAQALFHRPTNGTDRDSDRPPVVLAGDIAAAASRPKFSAERPAPLTGVILVETALPEENDPGSASLQYGDGQIRRFAVRDWIDSETRLVDVSDVGAIFEVRGQRTTLALKEARVPASKSDASPGLPGIDINARPNTANPAIAR